MLKEFQKKKKKMLKALVAVKGQEKICDTLAAIDEAFDILLTEQIKEIRKMVEGKKKEIIKVKDWNDDISILEVINNGREDLNQAINDILKKIK